MRLVDIHEAKTRFSRLVEEVRRGGEIVILQAGRPVARLVPMQTGRRRKLGVLSGQLNIPPDFDAPLSDDMIDH